MSAWQAFWLGVLVAYAPSFIVAVGAILSPQGRGAPPPFSPPVKTPGKGPPPAPDPPPLFNPPPLNAKRDGSGKLLILLARPTGIEPVLPP